MTARLVATCLIALGCKGSTMSHTRAFVAPASCGQGPYEVQIPANGTKGSEGVEVIACTPRRLAGRAQLLVGDQGLGTESFGDVADNARCLVGREVPVTHGPTAAATRADDAYGEDAAAAVPSTALSERHGIASETYNEDELCGKLGLRAQTVMPASMMIRNDYMAKLIRPGAQLRVRVWSELPNDLDGVVFMVRHLVSRNSVEEDNRSMDEASREGRTYTPPPPDPIARRGPPPAALVEAVPPRPNARAVWIPGYWTWTGERWGWLAGFWRDDALALPAPQIEIPGEPPGIGAIWIGGSWEIRAGAHVWIRGRWRR